MSKTQNIDQCVGRRLRELRSEQRWTVSDLTQRSGISSAQLHLYELGKTRLNSVDLFHLAGLLDVGVADFFPSSASLRYADQMQDNPHRSKHRRSPLDVSRLMVAGSLGGKKRKGFFRLLGQWLSSLSSPRR